MKNETIVALSTPVGVGAISIIRMSGDDSLLIAQKMFQSPSLDFCHIEPRKLYLGDVDFGLGKDKCLMVYFKNPFSYTGEDLIEFQIHGSVKLVSDILSQCLKNGARLASEGEFTKRAFINGKLSLDEAEGVIDTINAQSENELKAASALVQGKLYKIAESLQQKLTTLLARLEVSLDYPEHDIEYIEKDNAKKELKEIIEKLQALIENSDENQFIKNGINVAIVGSVNVGKSSLLNALIGEERAIVTNIEGTTRDIVKETIMHKGLKINFIDTAGIRQSGDEVEIIGINKSLAQIDYADVILLVFDASRAIEKDEKQLYEKVKNKKHIVIFNKIDLKYDVNLKTNFKEAILTSTKNDVNINLIKDSIVDLAINKKIDFSQVCLTNARHIEAIKNAQKYINEAIDCCNHETCDIVCMEIKKAWNELGKITGQTENESVIDEIFSKFCLGK